MAMGRGRVRENLTKWSAYCHRASQICANPCPAESVGINPHAVQLGQDLHQHGPARAVLGPRRPNQRCWQVVAWVGWRTTARSRARRLGRNERTVCALPAHCGFSEPSSVAHRRFAGGPSFHDPLFSSTCLPARVLITHQDGASVLLPHVEGRWQPRRASPMAVGLGLYWETRRQTSSPILVV